MPKSLYDIASKPIPTGEFVVRIDDIEAAMSQNDNPLLRFKGVVMTGPDRGRTIPWSRVLSDEAAWKLGDEIVLLGNYQTEEQKRSVLIPIESSDAMVEYLQGWIGKTFNVKVTSRFDQKAGRTFNDVAILSEARATSDGGFTGAAQAASAPSTPRKFEAVGGSGGESFESAQ